VVVAVPPMPDSAPSDVLKVGAKQFDFSRAVNLNPQPRPSWPPGQAGKSDSERVESTARTRNQDLRDAAVAPIARTRSTWPYLLAAALVGTAGGALALYHYHLPPFSPPPKPITEPPLKLAVEEPSPSASPVAVTHVEPPPPREEPKEPPRLVEAPKKNDEVEKLLQKGRLLMISGHAHTAADTFRKAEKLRPKDAALRVYEQQALGKLGHAELQLEGKGSAAIDGKKFSAPRKLKVAAGPHVVDLGEGEFELTRNRGEKKKLQRTKK